MTIPHAHGSIADVVGRNPVVAIGNFDGVHVGHQSLLAHARTNADKLGVGLVVVSFFPPAKVFFGGAQYLNTPREKQLLLHAAAADEVVVVGFDAAFAATPAERFVDALAALSPRLLVVGDDFRFGHGRTGDVALLQGACARVDALPLVSQDGAWVKSSAVRQALAEGDAPAATRLLGRPYMVVGEVVAGDRRGRSLGWPTANLARTPGKALPLGVYAVWVDTTAGRYAGMANVGHRPTFPDAQPALEAHLFDVDIDLYGQEIAVHLLERIRHTRTFASLTELKTQLNDDAQRARALLRAHPANATPLLPGFPGAASPHR
jgi:riboflavin kinase/FMN adenylyltransferase